MSIRDAHPIYSRYAPSVKPAAGSLPASVFLRGKNTRRGRDWLRWRAIALRSPYGRPIYSRYAPSVKPATGSLPASVFLRGKNTRDHPTGAPSTVATLLPSNPLRVLFPPRYFCAAKIRGEGGIGCAGAQSLCDHPTGAPSTVATLLPSNPLRVLFPPRYFCAAKIRGEGGIRTRGTRNEHT